MMTRCSICGAPLTGTVCSYCGTVHAGNARTAYGRTLSDSAQTSWDTEKAPSTDAFAADTPLVSRKSRWIAFVLCLLLGWLGVHRFYVGKIGTGFLYAFTRGLYGIGWIVDLILILMGRFEDADGLPLNSA